MSQSFELPVLAPNPYSCVIFLQNFNCKFKLIQFKNSMQNKNYFFLDLTYFTYTARCGNNTFFAASRSFPCGRLEQKNLVVNT